ncbi:MAG: DUF882 domain-containing protein [Albidovulum sp.]|nr:DUF882 domain-containing protein [Albidovulum sp.]
METRIARHGNAPNKVNCKLPSLEKVNRRTLVQGIFAGAICVAAAPAYTNTPGYLKGAGNIRRLKMYSGHTGEYLNAVYWIDGEYIPEVMGEIDFFMRDWRDQRKTRMDRRNIDNLSAISAILETDEPFKLLSGFRTRRTNDILRRTSRSVARNSLHIKGQAADVQLKNRSSRQIASAATKCASGGVGRYRRPNFVHIDCGDVRTWQI